MEDLEEFVERVRRDAALAHFQLLLGKVVDVVDTHFVADGETALHFTECLK